MPRWWIKCRGKCHSECSPTCFTPLKAECRAWSNWKKDQPLPIGNSRCNWEGAKWWTISWLVARICNHKGRKALHLTLKWAKWGQGLLLRREKDFTMTWWSKKSQPIILKTKILSSKQGSLLSKESYRKKKSLLMTCFCSKNNLGQHLEWAARLAHWTISLRFSRICNSI